MKKNTLKWILIIAGALLFLISLIADFVWAGSYPGYHIQQIIAIIVGALVLLIGLLLKRE